MPLRFPYRLTNLLKLTRTSPQLSIIVVVFNMRREAPRTLFSLSPAYQRGVSAEDYEVIVVENGSTEPLMTENIIQLGSNFRYLWIDKALPSPASAINQGVALSQAPYVGIMIDGARIATPGIVALALEGLQRFERAVVGTVGFHLGPDTQMYSLRHGYNRTTEDELLTHIDWENNGYRLFEIGAQAGSSPLNWLGAINESNLLFLPRTLFDDLGGYDERFTLPGGGIVNLDFYRRACDLERSTLITLLGEATFHQVHGGAITNQPATELPQRLQTYAEEYLRIRGAPFINPTRSALLLGYIQPESFPWLRKACDFAAQSQLQRFLSGCTNSSAPAATPASDLPTTPALPFSLLSLLGLREGAYLLELISDSAPTGLLLVPFLQPNHYYAIDYLENTTADTITASLGVELMGLKQPRFARNQDFNLDCFETDASFDFILAPTLFRHAGPTQIRHCLASVRHLLKPTGLFVAAFDEVTTDNYRDEWIYPNLNYYCWATLGFLCAESRLHSRKLAWPHTNQTWFVATLDLRRLEPLPPSIVTAAVPPESSSN